MKDGFYIVQLHDHWFFVAIRDNAPVLIEGQDDYHPTPDDRALIATFSGQRWVPMHPADSQPPTHFTIRFGVDPRGPSAIRRERSVFQWLTR